MTQAFNNNVIPFAKDIKTAVNKLLKGKTMSVPAVVPVVPAVVPAVAKVWPTYVPPFSIKMHRNKTLNNAIKFPMSQLDMLMDNVTKSDLERVRRLTTMLNYMRPSGKQTGKAYTEFLETFIEPIMGKHDSEYNYVHIIGNDGKPISRSLPASDGSNMPRVAYMAHHDTVHRNAGGKQTPRMRLVTEESELGQFENIIMCVENPKPVYKKQMVETKKWNTVLKANETVMEERSVETEESKKTFTSSCLGADCTTGVWMILEMIQFGCPGVYVIHNDEEVGCVGSHKLSSEYELNSKASSYSIMTFEDKSTAHPYTFWIGYVDIAMSFDRWGTSSIITHQSGGQTCSDEFADSLSPVLSAGFVANGYPELIKDTGGSCTDSLSYKRLIKECTNISVGYVNQHQTSETQDLSFALLMCDALIDGADSINNPEIVKAVRDPKAVPPTPNYAGMNYPGRGVAGNHKNAGYPSYANDYGGMWSDGYGYGTDDWDNPKTFTKKHDKTKNSKPAISGNTDIGKFMLDWEKEYDDNDDMSAFEKLEADEYALEEERKTSELERYLKRLDKTETANYLDILDAIEQEPERMAYWLLKVARVNMTELVLFMTDESIDV